MLHLRCLDTVRITKIKGHADEGMVLDGRVLEVDRLGNDAADEAADFGRRRVCPAVIDARRNFSGVCSRWYPVILDLHRFFIAISRAVVNHDDLGGTAPHPLVWSAGHWLVGDLSLGVGGVSYVELLILYELWAGERLSLEKAHPRYLRPRRPISVSAVPFGPGIDIWRSCHFIGALMRSLCLLPGGLRRFVPCSIGADHCRLRQIGWGKVWSWSHFSAA